MLITSPSWRVGDCQQCLWETLPLEKMQRTFHVGTFVATLAASVGRRHLEKGHSSLITFTPGSIYEKPMVGGWGCWLQLALLRPVFYRVWPWTGRR